MTLTGEFFSVSGDFSAYIEEYDEGLIQRIRLEWIGAPMSFEDAIALMKWNEVFLDFLSSLLTHAEMDGYVWEAPPVSSATLSRQFEFVLIDTGQPYHKSANPEVFRDHMRETDGVEGVIAFENLGCDALLIVPSPVEGRDYRDLLHFLQTAETSHVHMFWKKVSAKLSERLSDQPVWMSVSGAGVPWLHLRLDNMPKYYQYAGYRPFVAN